MIALIIAAFAAVMLVLCLVRVFVGPTLYDRMLAMNATLAKAALIVAALAVATGNAAHLDAALTTVLIGLVFNVAVLKVFRAKSFQPPLARPGEQV
jgi:multicomponent Na+:H+ antiporter subunit F